MYRKLMMLLAVVSVLGLVIGLVGCPQQETVAPPTGVAPPRPTGQPGLPGGPPLPTPVEEEEEAPEEEAPEEAPARPTGD